MKKYSTLIFFIVVITFVLTGLQRLRENSLNSPIQNERVVQEYKAGLVINDGTNSLTFDVSGYIGKTVLEATRIVLDGKMTTSGSGENSFVTALNGREANVKKREFWEMLVNGKQAEVGAGTYVIKNNDQIEWKISNY